jgi:hypothetical protein
MILGHNNEASLDDLLGDGATQLLMAADGVHEGAIRELIDAVIEARNAIQGR